MKTLVHLVRIYCGAPLVVYSTYASRSQTCATNGLKNLGPIVQSISECTTTRRNFGKSLTFTTAYAANSLVAGAPKNAHAVSPSTPAEAIRRSAASIPSYGPTDVFFPETWAGSWHVQRQVTLGDSANPPMVLDYNIRFLRSIQDGAVVADRGFNQANLEAAAEKTPMVLPNYEWTFTNPNDLRLTWSDGRTKDIKVTQRASDYTQQGMGRIWSSEVQRVTTDNGSVPIVTARRVVTQYRWEDNFNTTTDSGNTAPMLVQALEVIYDLGGASDPMKAGRPTNTILSKSRIVMQKI